jgi:hypothetical protein
VAEHAGVWNALGARHQPGQHTARGNGRLSRVLDGHCEAAGRDPAAVRHSVQLRFKGDIDDTAAPAAAQLRHGITEFIVTADGDNSRARAKDAAGRLLPRPRELAT